MPKSRGRDRRWKVRRIAQQEPVERGGQPQYIRVVPATSESRPATKLSPNTRKANRRSGTDRRKTE
ncbi:MAG: hypothetical protein QGI60_02180 [archaeon]|nr:hypothetical protein [archaeon]